MSQGRPDQVHGLKLDPLHVHTLSFILYAPSIHACRDVTVLRLVGGGTVEEDILQCAQSKLQLEHDLTASTDHGEGRGHGHNIDTVFTLYGELHLNGFGECNY